MWACSPALTVATAIPAAVISMAVLPLFGRSNILENNIVATGASAGTSISAGAIFTLPALILLHHWNELRLLVDPYHRRLGRLARGVVFGAAAPDSDHRAEAAFPGRRRRGRSAQSRREPRHRRQGSRHGHRRRRHVQIHHLRAATRCPRTLPSAASSASAASHSSATASRRRCWASATSSGSTLRF